MGRLKEDFALAAREQRIKYCVNLIEQAALEGSSKNKTIAMLERLGADLSIITEAFLLAEDLELPTEKEKAMQTVDELLRKNDKPMSAAIIRKIATKLTYKGFEEEIIEEIVENLSYEFDA